MSLRFTQYASLFPAVLVWSAPLLDVRQSVAARSRRREQEEGRSSRVTAGHGRVPNPFGSHLRFISQVPAVSQLVQVLRKSVRLARYGAGIHMAGHQTVAPGFHALLPPVLGKRPEVEPSSSSPENTRPQLFAICVTWRASPTAAIPSILDAPHIAPRPRLVEKIGKCGAVEKPLLGVWFHTASTDVTRDGRQSAVLIAE